MQKISLDRGRLIGSLGLTGLLQTFVQAGRGHMGWADFGVRAQADSKARGGSP
jgi:hypothetical protein